MDENLNKVVEYDFPQGYRAPWLEDILKEFGVETKVSWYKESEFFDTPIYKFEEPDYPDLYSIVYTCLPEINNPHHEFAESLIESTLSYIGYIEGCLTIEDNKKEDI